MYSSHLAASSRSASIPRLSLVPEIASLERLFVSQPVETFEPGGAVFWEGDAASHVFHVHEGCLRLYRILPDGRRAVMGFAHGGEMIGVPFPASYPYSAEAVTKVRLRRLGRGRFNAVVDGSDSLRPLLLARMQQELGVAHKHMIVLARLSAEERVVAFLLSAARRTGAEMNHPVAVELPISRLDIADYLGLTIETVCRTISKLKRDGLITVENRHTVILNRMGSLEKLAGGTDEVDDAPPLRIAARH
jgi:CRP/FNR family transcriptional regulator